MNERLNSGEQLAGIGGLALILIMFLFAWYGIDGAGINGFDAFDAYGDWFNIILVFTAFAGMSLALFGSGVARVPASLSVLAAMLGGLSTIILIIYIISPPGLPTLGEAVVEIDLDRKIGVWLGLISAIAVAVGGYLAMQEEGTSFGDAADRLSSGTGGGPSTTPPPPPSPPPPPQSSPPPPPTG
jgi:hypothetical protein